LRENAVQFLIIENGYMRRGIVMVKNLILIAVCLAASVAATDAQEKPADAKIKEPVPKTVKKTNQRPVEASKTPTDPFEKATVEAMAAQCVKFETEAGIIEMEMYPESAPESVRGFLNLAGSGSLDTTTFSRVVPGFVIQGGDLFTREKMTPEIDKRARRVLPDEPSQIKHERGVLSMARGDEPNSASTHFFILLREARTLDGKFAAFGRVTKGMETVEAINKMPVEGEKPTKPVRITRATAMLCPVPAKL
jgi:peptidyl-prolyl cis-trans isomerase B (cyclophilin B)